jgi:hypothetical protein
MSKAASLRHLSDLTKELSELEKSSEIDVKAIEVLKHILENMAEDNLHSIDRVITEGLRRVFHDQTDICFKSEFVERGNQLQIGFKTEQGDASGKALDSFGASVVVVESLLLRILVILKMGLAPVLLLDESLAQVSDHYVEPVGKLIKKLCDDLGLTVLLVTHQSGFQESADNIYRADAKEDDVIRTLTLKRIKIQNSEMGD